MTGRFIALLVASILGLGLAGCASGPAFNPSSVQEIKSDQGRLYFYRPSGMGAAVQPAVRIDGVEVGKSVPKGYFIVERPPGQYVVSASTEAKRSLTINLEGGEEKYIRLEVKMGLFVGHIKPVLVDPATGRREILETKAIE